MNRLSTTFLSTPLNDLHIHTTATNPAMSGGKSISTIRLIKLRNPNKAEMRKGMLRGDVVAEEFCMLEFANAGQLKKFSESIAEIAEYAQRCESSID